MNYATLIESPSWGKRASLRERPAFPSTSVTDASTCSPSAERVDVAHAQCGHLAEAQAAVGEHQDDQGSGPVAVEWRPQIAEGHELVLACIRRRRLGQFQLQAAIQGLHCAAPDHE